VAIIRTIACDAENLTERVGGFNEGFLLFGGRPRQDLEPRDGLNALLWVKSTEGRTFHDDASGGIGAALSSERAVRTLPPVHISMVTPT